MILLLKDKKLGILQVVAITLSISAFTFVAVFAAMLLLAPVLPLTRNLTSRQIEGIASLAATLMIARSPASAVRPCSRWQ